MSNLFKGPDPIPEEEPVPLPDEEALERARRRRLSATRTRGGRASTALAAAPTGGGAEFSKTLLG